VSEQPRAEGVDLAESLAGAEQSILAETISGAGLYNQKSETLIDTAAWVVETFGSAAEFDAFVRDEDPETVRETLLEVRGVGPKTADCVLLFAGGRDGIFPVDTHVHRIYRRMGIVPPDADHEGFGPSSSATCPRRNAASATRRRSSSAASTARRKARLSRGIPTPVRWPISAIRWESTRDGRGRRPGGRTRVSGRPIERRPSPVTGLEFASRGPVSGFNQPFFHR